MRLSPLSVAAIFLLPVYASFGPLDSSHYKGGSGWDLCEYDNGHYYRSIKRTGSDLREYLGGDNGKDDDDKYSYYKSKICWTAPQAPKSYQTYHVSKTWTKPGKGHTTIAYSDTPKNPLPTTADTPPSYTIAPPQPTTETLASSTVPVVINSTTQPVTSLIPTTPSLTLAPTTTFKPSTAAPPQQGNSTVPSPPIFTGDAPSLPIKRTSLLVTTGAVLVAMLLL